MIKNYSSLPKPVHVKFTTGKINSFYYVDAINVPIFFNNLKTKYKQPIERFTNNIKVSSENPIVIRVTTSEESGFILDIGYVSLPNICYYTEHYGYFETPISASKFISPISEVKYG